MRILIVDDDDDIRESLKVALEAETYSIDSASDGEKGSYLARTNEYDLVVLDYMMPKKDGKTVCMEIRQAGKSMPIIMLTVRSTTEAKVELLNTGADDYLTKPFSFQELRARIQALLRRPRQLETTTFELEDLTVDTLRHRVSRQNKEIYLTRKEFGLLEYLLRHQGIVVSRGMIMEHVWDSEGDPFSNTIEAHILNLRKKIDHDFKKKLLYTVPGRGYTIDSERKESSDKK
ncbi:MAG: DNA-binding response regulator [Candidatus Paceibacter sp.]|jgi:DNA-binding response OmpR family regulator|nr:DNA-binding response regulator [Candidatus Paceibacter sp.]